MAGPTAAQGEAGALHALIIGGGFSRLYQLLKLRDQIGVKVKALEQGGGGGGTWYFAVGVDAPPASSSRIGLSESNTGAVHVRHYPHWHQHVQGRLHAALRRRYRPGCTTNQPPPCANGPLLQEACPHQDRHGGL